VSRAGAKGVASDPDERARRIARALISDIVVYHKDRCERSLRDGTLRTEFKEEILKSWDEYVEQVGLEVARGTSHFRDALNEILARGQKVF
jgi:capsid protein